MPVISNTMTRNRFFKLRSSIKVVNDLDVTKETKKTEFLWKVGPFLDRMKQGSLNLPKPGNVCIGSMSK